jgi:hyperosmotically inducible periplasmic protein
VPIRQPFIAKIAGIAGIAASALLLSLLLSACASTVPTQRVRASEEARREQDVSDARLRNEIRLALLDKLGQDALGITVVAAGGRVGLYGAVHERSTQELAEEVAKSVPGVLRVDNRLSSRRTSADAPVASALGHAGREVDDAVLEVRVGKALLSEIGRYALDVEIEASDGAVSLRGTLPDPERKSLALKAAERTSGVVKVVDLLQVGHTR